MAGIYLEIFGIMSVRQALRVVLISVFHLLPTPHSRAHPLHVAARATPSYCQPLGWYRALMCNWFPASEAMLPAGIEVNRTCSAATQCQSHHASFLTWLSNKLFMTC